MSLVLPEISLLKALEGLIKWLRFNHEDFVDKGNEEGSFLYRLFGTIEHNGFSYYDEAKRIFLSDPLDQRKLGVRIFFDASRAHVPTIHITLPGESHQDSGLGMNTDGMGFEREQNTRYSLVITSDNYSEVIIIYYTIRSLLTSGFMTLEAYGIRNMKLSGGDLTLQQDIVPSNVFFRAIFVDMFYDEVIPDMEYDSDDIIRGIYLQGRVVEGGGELPPIPDPSPEFRLKHNRLDEESRALPDQHPTDAITNKSNLEGESLTDTLNYLEEFGVTLDNIAGLLDPQAVELAFSALNWNGELGEIDVFRALNWT